MATSESNNYIIPKLQLLYTVNLSIIFQIRRIKNTAQSLFQNYSIKANSNAE